MDASPLVVRWGDSPALVFTGSHSGLLLAAWLRSGEELWRAQLSDRIESSACVSPCGRYIIVGERTAELRAHKLYEVLLQFSCLKIL